MTTALEQALSPVTAGAMPYDRPTAWQSLGPLSGVVLAIGVLLCVWLMLEIARSFLKLQSAREGAGHHSFGGSNPARSAPLAQSAPLARSATATAAAGAAAPPAAREEVPMTVIAAAIAAALDEPFRILAVRPVETVAWSVEGRRQIFASHQLHRGR